MIKIADTIRRMMGARNLAYEDLAAKYEEVTGLKMGQSKLSYKVRNETIHLDELRRICSILGYTVCTREKGTEVYLPVGPVKETLSLMCLQRQVSQREVMDIFNERYGTTYVRQSFSRKVTKDSISVSDFQKTIDILGHEFNILDALRDNEPIGVPFNDN